jgi:hypothetical protein
MTEPWRSSAAQKGARTRKAMAAARGEEPRCSRCGGRRPAGKSYCDACHAARMAVWRASKRERDVSRANDAAAAAEEVTMSEVAASQANGLSGHKFAPLPDEAEPAPENATESEQREATVGVDLDALAGEIGALPTTMRPTFALSPTAYLMWLLLQIHDALQLAEHCRTSGQSVRAEPPVEPAVAAIPDDLSRFERRLLEVGARMGRQSLELARRQALAEAARAEAFNPGLKFGPQVD